MLNANKVVAKNNDESNPIKIVIYYSVFHHFSSNNFLCMGCCDVMHVYKVCREPFIHDYHTHENRDVHEAESFLVNAFSIVEIWVRCDFTPKILVSCTTKKWKILNTKTHIRYQPHKPKYIWKIMKYLNLTESWESREP